MRRRPPLRATALDPMLQSAEPETVRQRLEQVRERTLALIAPVEWGELRRQHVPILSPMVWDLGHVANFEEQWLLRALGSGGPLVEGYDTMFDPTANPRPTREGLPLPDRRKLFDYLGRVREAVLERAAGNGSGAGAGGGADLIRRLLDHGFVYEMVAEHEEQHQETLLQALQAMGEPHYLPAGDLANGLQNTALRTAVQG
jgi:iron(II)-dependent oxidoreductase